MPSIPNLPVPINGMIKTYDNAGRTFTRPYSAKTIFFYKLGDDYFQGVRIPVSKARYRTMEALLDDLSAKVPMEFGVRKLFTPSDYVEVTSIDDLQHMGRYMCSSSTWAARRNVRSVDRLQGRLAPLFNKSEEKQVSNDDSINATRNAFLKEQERMKRVKMNVTPPAINSHSTKQVLFNLNGMPNRVYRMQFRVKRMPVFEDVLREVGNMLNVSVAKFYTPNGEQVLTVDDIVNGPAQLIACQKHEKPFTENAAKLPPLGNSNKSRSSEKTFTTSMSKDNSKSAVPLPPLSPRKKRIKKHMRKRTVSKKRKRPTDENQEDEAKEMTEAALKIQSSVRGKLARKNYLQKKFDGDAEFGEVEEAAAVKIQAAMRGHATRKQLKRKQTEGQIEVNGVDDESIPNDPEATTDVIDQQEMKVESKPLTAASTKQKKSAKKTETRGKYNVSIFTGNRWAADTDSDLYIIMIGENDESEKTWLKQTEQEPKFQQNQVDTFDIETKKLGKLKKLTIGHETTGYGSGIFLERVVINEINGDMLQYVFPCSKWMDSAQVDGKTERTLNCAGYYNLKTMPLGVHDPDLVDADDEDHFLSSRGRYRISLSCGKVVANPPNAKTSLFLVCYGSYTHSDPLCVVESLSAKSAGTVQQFDVDCSNVGELYKMRFEIESTEENSISFQLENIDIRDVDTNEEIFLSCNKWLCKSAPPDTKVLHPQLFRELAVIRVGLEPLPTFLYNVSMKLSSNLYCTKLPCELSVQLTGEFGDSGIYHVPMTGSTDESTEVKFVIESVSLGRMLHMTYSFPADDKGQTVAEGFRILNDLYEKHGLSNNVVGQPWLVESGTVRESIHAPYLFMFNDTRTIDSDVPGTIKRKLMLTEMEGLSTKMKEKRQMTKSRQKSSVKDVKDKPTDGMWRVSVTTGQHPEAGMDSTPFLIVYGETGNSEPIPLLDKNQNFVANSTCQFTVDLTGIGRIIKIRLRLDSQGPRPIWYLKKIKMKEVATGEELRFPVEMWLEKSEENPEIAVELPAVWPDVPPLPSLLYQVTVHTGTDSENETEFDVSVIIFGEKGDSGKRFLRSAVGTQSQSCFKPGNVDTFELEAVSVRQISQLQVIVEPTKDSISWYLALVDVYDPESDVVYHFACNKWFSATKEEKKYEHTLNPTSVMPVSTE